MGRNPRRLDGLRADEKVAALLVERATGATARAHDIGARQGAYDVDLVYPGGRTAALEVTTHAGAGVRHASALLGAEQPTWPNPGGWSWALHVGSTDDLPRLRAVYARAVSLCEAHVVATPAELPPAVLGADPELAWLARDSTSVLRGRPPVNGERGRPCGVVVVTRTTRGPVDSGLTGLPQAVTRLLEVDHVARRAAKVAAVPGVDERHLFVGLGKGGLPDTLYLPLTVPLEALPSEEPDVPEALSHVWLTTLGRGAPLLRWDRSSGWAAFR